MRSRRDCTTRQARSAMAPVLHPYSLGRGPWRARQAQGVEDGGVEHERHGVRVQRLPAERPHEWAVRKVQRSRDDRGAGRVPLQDFLRAAARLSGHAVLAQRACTAGGAGSCAMAAMLPRLHTESRQASNMHAAARAARSGCRLPHQPRPGSARGFAQAHATPWAWLLCRRLCSGSLRPRCGAWETQAPPVTTECLRHRSRAAQTAGRCSAATQTSTLRACRPWWRCPRSARRRRRSASLARPTRRMRASQARVLAALPTPTGTPRTWQPRRACIAAARSLQHALNLCSLPTTSKAHELTLANARMLPAFLCHLQQCLALGRAPCIVTRPLPCTRGPARLPGAQVARHAALMLRQAGSL